MFNFAGMIHQINMFLAENITAQYGRLATDSLVICGIAAVAILSFYVARLVEGGIMYFIRRSPTTWDDDLLNSRFLKALSQLLPALLVAYLLPEFFSEGRSAFNWVRVCTMCYILWTVVYILHVFTDNLYNAFLKRDRMRPYAIKGIFQMVRLIVIGLGCICTLSILAGRSPVSILMALGASAAILMLVFKDTILGLVAGVQLTANNMLHRGDWIVVDKHGANGEVIDVSLTTVKVRNWDNSITTVPPYLLVSESFRNYQPMRLSGGRRVDRSILIDANTVRFCTDGELDALGRRGWLEDMDCDTAAGVVNMQLLRRYLERYLTTHPQVNADMLVMVRQMEPTSAGLPLQLYFFTRTVEWKEFERVQSDIFDHVYAVIREFGLRIYQLPAGADVASIAVK